MAARRYYQQDGSFRNTTQDTSMHQESNVFDASFGAGSRTGWADWMRWAGQLEAEPTSSYVEDGFESARSLCKASDTSSDQAYCSQNDFLFNDAPYNFDETLEPSQFSATPQSSQEYNTQAIHGQQNNLKGIAMSYQFPIQGEVEASSPNPPTYSLSRSSSLDARPITRKIRRRKTSASDDEKPKILSQTKRRGHNAIEKRYRTNLNDKISSLHQGIPPLWRKAATESNSGDEGEDSDIEDTEKKTSQKYGKAAVLTRALDYIQHLEGTTERLGDEVEGLKSRIGKFEKLALSDSVVVRKSSRSSRSVNSSETLSGSQSDSKHIKPETETIPDVQRTYPRK